MQKAIMQRSNQMSVEIRKDETQWQELISGNKDCHCHVWLVKEYEKVISSPSPF